jgi:hypothetical protein
LPCSVSARKVVTASLLKGFQVRLPIAILAGAVAFTLSAPISFADQTTTADSAPDLDKIVCKTMDPPTGTRLGGRRECMTQREWNDRTRQDRQQIEKSQTVGVNPSGG